MPEVKRKSRAKVSTTIELTLVLNEGEARYLMGLVQNPREGITPENESDDERTMRQQVWEALNEVL